MPTDLLELDATALAAAIREGHTTARAVTELYLARLAELNPEVNAVLEINPTALDLADALDRHQGPRGPLHGVPVLLKDNIDTGDDLHTSAGSWTLAEHCAERDAPLVARLRDAGAVILGKANMTEWANFMTVGMPNGFSSRGGQVRHPWGAGLDVGGSSSGSGAAVAARLVPLAVGTETSGSILSPASSNGIVGIKPTVGRVSRTGVIPISSSQDTAGPMTRTVRDAYLLLRAMSGPDDADETTLGAPDLPETLPDAALSGARLGVVRSVWDRLPEPQRRVLEDALDVLRAAGAEIVDGVELPILEDLRRDGLAVLLYEFKRDLNRYLAGVRQGPRSLRDVVTANEQAPEHAPFGQVLLLGAEATSGTLTEPAYLQARARDLELTRERGLDPLFASGIDALLTPGNWMAHVGAKAGYPSLTVPAGLADCAPVGLTLTGAAWSEARLAALAADYESARGPWRPAR